MKLEMKRKKEKVVFLACDMPLGLHHNFTKYNQNISEQMGVLACTGTIHKTNSSRGITIKEENRWCTQHTS